MLIIFKVLQIIISDETINRASKSAETGVNTYY